MHVSSDVLLERNMRTFKDPGALSTSCAVRFLFPESIGGGGTAAEALGVAAALRLRTTIQNVTLALELRMKRVCR